MNPTDVVILSGYALTCLAALVLRVRKPDEPRRYRLPLGPAIPLLATLLCRRTTTAYWS